MAELVQVGKDKYKVIGVLTDENIDKINSFKNRTTLILDNTVGLSSEMVSKIKNDRILFSIKGGLDYEAKEKYNDKKYIERTYVSVPGLKKIIKYFEYNESQLKPEWNEFEKAMYLYNALAVDIEYDEKDTISRSLNGILYGKLVCAGFALAYKEMLDRVGIKCHYQNQKKVHGFNVIEIEGKNYGVDVTWDNAKNRNVCSFANFGNDPEFYTRYGHKLEDKYAFFKEEGVDPWSSFDETNEDDVIYDKEEKIYDLSLITKEEFEKYYNAIKESIETRKRFRYNLDEQSIDIKNKYLPIDIVRYKITKEAKEELDFYYIYRFLKSRKKLQISDKLSSAFTTRCGYISDICNVGYNRKLNLPELGLDNYEFETNGNLEFSDSSNIRANYIKGKSNIKETISNEELEEIYTKLNNYLSKYADRYIEDIDTLIEEYEYKPDEWDADRQAVSGNIYSKLQIIMNSPERLMEKGYTKEEIKSIIERIIHKFGETHKQYENESNRKEKDIDFLTGIFQDDLGMIKKTIEYDLQKQITEDEFIQLFCNPDYIINLYEKYIKVVDKPFKFDDYDVTKEQLKEILNKIIKNYQINTLIAEENEMKLQKSEVKNNNLV